MDIPLYHFLSVPTQLKQNVTMHPSMGSLSTVHYLFIQHKCVRQLNTYLMVTLSNAAFQPTAIPTTMNTVTGHIVIPEWYEFFASGPTTLQHYKFINQHVACINYTKYYY